MGFLFALRHPAYVRVFQSTLRGLCERGHEVVILLGSRSARASRAEVMDHAANELDRLAAELDGLTVRAGVEPRDARQDGLGGQLRSWLDYLRFLGPEFEDAPKLRARARGGVPAALREATDAAAASPEFRAALAAMLRTVDHLLPVPEAVRALVAEQQPDAILVSPLLEKGTPQTAYLRAGRALGIPTALCVASWDNLTTAGLIHGDPTLVTVWNEAQRKEASELHGVSPQCVAVTGAPVYDEWFDQRPSGSRQEFCKEVGLPPERPFLLYVCSSGFIAPKEAAWIQQWIGMVRNSGLEELANMPVLIRPHPSKPQLDSPAAVGRLEALPDVVVHPRAGTIAMSGEALADYYDSIHYAAAVVGVNTSAMIESAVVGRGVHVLLSKRYRDTQEGAPHFAHLRTAGGGLIEATSDRREHAMGLARAVREEDRDRVAERRRRFLEAFIRPHGLDQPATPLMVDCLERVARSSAAPPERVQDPPSRDDVEAVIATLSPILGRAPRARRGSST